jgi:hypothetical protein
MGCPSSGTFLVACVGTTDVPSLLDEIAGL